MFYKKLVIGTEHDSVFGFPIHKILGYSALCHVAYRYGRFMMGYSMFANDWTDLVCISGHLALSFSSFLFPIRTQRNYQNQIIWRELQLHNIVFSSRSCAIFTFSHFFPSTYFATRFCIVMGFHVIADAVTDTFGQGTTMRSMSWDGHFIPVAYKIYFDRFYALSQFGATTFLIFSDSHQREHAFMILFPIQISTLMTLRLKGMIDNDTWHILYSLALLMNFPVGLCTNNGYFFLYTVFYLLRVNTKRDKYFICLVYFIAYYLYPLWTLR